MFSHFYFVRFIIVEEEIAILSEIDDEVKQDELFAFIKKYAKLISTLIVACIIGILAYFSWDQRQKKEFEAATQGILTAITGPIDNSVALLEKVANTSTTKISKIADLIYVSNAIKNNPSQLENFEKMSAMMQKYASSGDILLADLATVIYASYSPKPYLELINLLQDACKPNRPYRPVAMELTGIFYLKIQNTQAAIRCFEQIIEDKNTPSDMKNRISVMLAHIKK